MHQPETSDGYNYFGEPGRRNGEITIKLNGEIPLTHFMGAWGDATSRPRLEKTLATIVTHELTHLYQAAGYLDTASLSGAAYTNHPAELEAMITDLIYMLRRNRRSKKGIPPATPQGIAQVISKSSFYDSWMTTMTEKNKQRVYRAIYNELAA